MKDASGLDVTAANADAVHSYGEGVERLLAGEGGAAERFAAALALDDRFALAHLGMAIALEEQKDATGAAREKAAARSLAADASERERRHVALLCAFDDTAADAARAYLAEFPTDGLVLDALQRHLFFHGGTGRRSALVELFLGIDEHWGPHWYVDGKLGLHLEETGDLAGAHERAERSYEARPRNSSASHALVHIAHAEGRHREGAARLRAWLADMSREAPMHGHLWWHVTLSLLADDDDAGARALYDERVRPTRSSGSKALTLADAVGLLWSWHAFRPQTAPPWDEAIPLARDLAKTPGRPFVDVHVAAAFLATDDRAALAALTEAVASSTLPLARAVSLPLVRAIALVLDDPAAACAALAAAGDADAMGGSHVERELIAEIGHDAARRAGVAGVAVPSRAARRASPHPLFARANVA